MNSRELNNEFEFPLLRAVGIGKPSFESLEEFYQHAQRYNNPQEFVDEFVRDLQGIKPSVTPLFDPKLDASGSARVGGEHLYRIRIGEAGIHRESELFKTIFHEEMHIRLDRRIRANTLPENTLNILTNPMEVSALDNEENYVEEVAKRYYSLYIKKYKNFPY